MSLFRILGPLIAATCLSTPALAEDILLTKNCIDIVREYEIGAPEQRADHSLDSARIILSVPPDLLDYVYNENDPIALAEDWSPSGPQVAHDMDNIGNSGADVLNCAEIVVDFRVGERTAEGEEGYSVAARTKARTTDEAKLRILLIDRHDREGDAQQQYYEWQKTNYRIGVHFDPLDAGETTLRPSTFSGILDFFPNGAQGQADHVLSIPLPADSKHATAESGEPLIPRLLVICGEPCRQIHDVVQAEGDEPSSPVPDAVVREAMEPETEETVDIGNTRPPQVSDPYATFTTQVAGMNSNGGRFTDGFDTIENLACLVHVIAPESDIFFNPPECTGALLEQISQNRAGMSIRITDDGQWVFGQHVVDTPLERLTVTLPAGVNGSICRMDASIEAPDGPVSVPLEFVPGSDPTAYSGRVTRAISPVNGQFTVRISPSNAADCGGPARRAVVDASAELTVPLLENPTAKTAFTYLFIPDFGTNELQLGATGTTARGLSEGLIQAALSAHHRMAVTNPGAAFDIQESLGIALSQNGSDMLFRLNAEQLRSSNVAAINLDSQVETLSRNSFPFNENSLVRGLMSLSEEARKGGFDKVEFIVAGGVLRNDSIVPAAPCSPATFDTVRAGIAEIEDLDIRVHIMPIVKLEPGQVPDFDVQKPLTFSTNAAGQPGGLFQCTASPNAPMTVYPFYVESWRETRDAIPRLTSAMTDQTAVLLQEYVK